MPKKTTTTIIGAKFDLSTGGSVTVGEEEIPARVLHIIDGLDRYDVVIADENAAALADLIRADGIVVPKPQIVPVPGTKGARARV